MTKYPFIVRVYHNGQQPGCGAPPPLDHACETLDEAVKKRDSYKGSPRIARVTISFLIDDTGQLTHFHRR